jgi:hypothetical protein
MKFIAGGKPPTNDLTGRRFGRLVVVGFAGRSCHGHIYFDAICDCGEKTVSLANTLRNGQSQSCGCLRLERITTHDGTQTPEFAVWCGMLNRCRNSNAANFDRYGGKGIRVCERWDLFETFLADMGPRPSPRHSIDRFPDANGNYEPGNCRWATPSEQAENRSTTKRFVIDGIERTLPSLIRERGLSRDMVYNRLRRGESIEMALRPQERLARRKGQKVTC